MFASFGNKGLLAVDFDGRILWHRSLGRFDNYHGTAGLAAALQGQADSVSRTTPAAASSPPSRPGTAARSGAPSDRARVGWSTPIAIRAFDHDEIVVSSQSRVHAYDPETGREIWSCRGNLSEVIPTPVVGHGLVFCSSGRAGPTLAIKPGGKGDVTNTHVAWQSPRGSPFVPSPLLYGEYLYLVNDMSSIATAFEAVTGKTMWQGRLGVAAREGFSASPVRRRRQGVLHERWR